MFLLLIVIHEFGHFISAKFLGVRVNEFAVGFGPKLFSKKVGETEYFLKLIPFGGYCAMEGEDEDSDDPHAFCNKKAWRRLIIVAMGAIFNLILGLIIIAIILAPSKQFTTTTVAGFYENSVSSEHGLEVGDTIIGVDGRKIFSTYDLGYSFTNIDDGRVDITVERDGREIELSNVKFNTREEDGITYFELDFYVKGQKKDFLSYIAQIFKTALSYGAVIWRSLIDLLAGKYGISAMSGPVGITATVGSVAKTNLFDILPIMALITINLGIFNLMPLPALDGGRIVFIIFEMIFRKPVPQKLEGWVHAVGLILLLGLMFIVTAKDIWTLIF